MCRTRPLLITAPDGAGFSRARARMRSMSRALPESVSAEHAVPAGAGAHARVAFVLGGGGVLGATQVGMLRALLESGRRPSLIVGTSVGALNGAAVAADPTLDGVAALAGLWGSLSRSGVFAGSLLSQASTLARHRTHLHSAEPLRRLLAGYLPELIEDLAVPFQCVAASVENAAAH